MGEEWIVWCAAVLFPALRQHGAINNIELGGGYVTFRRSVRRSIFRDQDRVQMGAIEGRRAREDPVVIVRESFRLHEGLLAPGRTAREVGSIGAPPTQTPAAPRRPTAAYHAHPPPRTH